MVKYLLDTANIDEINYWNDYIEGVTINPILLRDESIKSPEIFLEQIRLYIEKKDRKFDFKTFVQIHSWDEYLILKDYGKDPYINPTHLFNTVFKVPLIEPKGYDLLRRLKLQKISNTYKLCGTITYDLIQLHQACDLGCDYCIVLIAKNVDTNFLEKAVKFRELHNYNIKLIGASFRTKTDVQRALLSGVDYITVPPKLLKKVFDNPMVSKDFEEHNKCV
jgi:hypothetical protein